MVLELCSWFDEHRRDLPWRRNRDPYSIWISEAMLQQTRVEAVLEYHARFLECLPGVADLAQAPMDQVLALWSGLGYYQRARALHAAAAQIMELHAGEFPRSHAQLLALPGVGAYTAGAVLSIAFQESEPLVDGNVARVFSRLFGLEAELGAGPSQKLLWRIARFMVPKAPKLPPGADLPRVCPGNWNQALMELGALVCTAKSPSCEACPLRVGCVAHRDGRVHELPRKAKRSAPIEVRIEALLLLHDQRILLQQRPKGGRMEGLWELPTREIPGELGLQHGLWPEAFQLAPLSPPADLGPAVWQLSHAITKHRIKGSLHAGRLSEQAAPPMGDSLRWVSPLDCAQLGVTGLTKKCLRVLQTEAASIDPVPWP